MAHVTAVVVRGHLDAKTTQELCDDFEHLKQCARPMPWAEQAISDALFHRNEVAWFEWQFSSHAFGVPMPHRYFGLI